jgi:hypothetical protein
MFIEIRRLYEYRTFGISFSLIIFNPYNLDLERISGNLAKIGAPYVKRLNDICGSFTKAYQQSLFEIYLAYHLQ